MNTKDDKFWLGLDNGATLVFSLLAAFTKYSGDTESAIFWVLFAILAQLPPRK